MVVGKVAFSHIYKCLQLQQARGTPALRSTCTSRYLSSQSDDKSNDGGKNDAKKSEKQPKQKAKSRLNDLLQSIVKDQETRDSGVGKKSDAPKIEYKLAKPVREKPTDEEVDAALKEKETTKEIGKEMLSAVKTVAKSVEGDPKATESELVQKLKSHALGKVNLSELFVGMRIDKTKKTPSAPPGPTGNSDLSRAHRVRRVLEEQRDAPRGGYRDRGRPQRDGDGDDRRRPPFSERQRRTVDQSQISYAPIDMFGAPPLGIFSRSDKPASSYLKTWDALFAKDLKSAATHPPANGFEEMILWTEQEKLWQYPINNEQGLDEEAKVSFQDHVFLEPHIEGWCPKRGPIRHFMELVCVGLSKNPYMTVQEKKDHIEWYHEYFMGKAAIIKELGAGEIK